MDFVAVGHWVEERCIVVDVHHVHVDGERGREAGSTRILGLNDKYVVLHL